MKIMKDGNYRTKYGLKVRIYETDHMRPYCVIGAVFKDEGWQTMAWTLEGGASQGSCYDLVEIDPHGITDRHREILENALIGQGMSAERIMLRKMPFDQLDMLSRSILIALATLERELTGHD